MRKYKKQETTPPFDPEQVPFRVDLAFNQGTQTVMVKFDRELNAIFWSAEQAIAFGKALVEHGEAARRPM